AIVRVDGLDDLPIREAVLDEPQRIDDDLKLALLPAPRQHVVDPGRGAKHQPDRPILNRAQIHRRQLAGKLLVGLLDGVPEHLTEARRVRSDPRRAVAFRNALRDLLETLADEPPCEVDVDVVREVDRDVREAEQRYGSDLL